MLSRPKLALFTLLAMLAFAGNSLLCRLALLQTGIDAASFTTIRIVSGALMLYLIVRLRGSSPRAAGSWTSALALFAYAVGFSFAYIGLPAGTGALLLFGAVQATMIGYGLWRGERLRWLQILGLAAALIGLVGLLLPGIAAPSPMDAALMLLAGIAWGVYSLRSKGAGDPLTATAGNFLRALPLTLGLSLILLSGTSVSGAGALYAIVSGALTSGVGYAIWYSALSGLNSTKAATVQLSVPVITALGGLLFLGEPLTLRLLFAAVAILGGVALVLVPAGRPAVPPLPQAGDREAASRAALLPLPHAGEGRGEGRTE